MSNPPLLAQVAEFAAGIRWASLPDVVRHQARLNVLDTIGCIVSGVPLDESKRLLRAELAMGGKAESTVPGSREKVSMRAAARINGYMGDVFELNDLIGGHASIATITPALALAEAIGATPRQMLEASVTGIEVVCRVHGGFYAHQKPFTETGMTQVGIANAIGAAAAAGKLFGFDRQGMLDAMGTAGALAGWAPAEVVFGEGNLVKPMLFGAWPASVGLMAAMYAKEGINGSSRLLESNIGYYATVARSHDAEVVLNFTDWRLAQPRRKLHACCGYTHSAIDLVAKLRRDGVDFQAAREIRIHVPAYIVPAVSKADAPDTGNEARFNLQYCLAHAAVDTDVILPDHSLACARHTARPEIEAMRRKFTVVVEPKYSHYRYATAEVIDASGKVVLRADNDAPRGSEWNPMTDDEVRQKFSRLAAPLLSDARIGAYLQRFEGIESERQVDWLLGEFNE
jgi:2-methylcitrate dehydratase PrpD